MRIAYLVFALIISECAWGKSCPLPPSAPPTCTLPPDHQLYVDITSCGANTGYMDNQGCINAALEAAAAGNYPGIYVPQGVFVTSGNHHPAPGIGIYGRGALQLTAESVFPIIDTNQTGNTISDLTLDLSKNTGVIRAAIDIDGGSVGTVVSNVTSNYGRIVAYVTNAGDPPTQIHILNNLVFAAVTGGTSAGAIDMYSGTSHFYIVGNQIDGNWRPNISGSKAGSATGITVEAGSTYGDITGNHVFANLGNGIFIYSGYQIAIANNNVFGNQLDGIGVNSGDCNTPADPHPCPGQLSITGNLITRNVYDGIDITEGSAGANYLYITVQGNYIAGNGPSPSGGGTGIILANAENVTISSNVIFSNANAGIYIYSSQNIAVSGNTVANNSISNPGSVGGIYLINSMFNAISGNICTNNGGTPSQAYGIEESSSVSDYNTFTGNNTQNNIAGGLRVIGIHDVQAGNL